jgi:hypothetical protein
MCSDGKCSSRMCVCVKREGRGGGFAWIESFLSDFLRGSKVSFIGTAMYLANQ